MRSLITNVCSEWRSLTRLEQIVTTLIVGAMVILFGGQILYAAGVVVPNTVTTAGDYPVADSNQVKGGPLFLNYTADLRAVSENLKQKGMIAHVRENDTYYRAYSTHGHYWELYAPASGGGVTVHNNLSGRDAADAHPIAAITGLQPALDSKLPAATLWNMTASFRSDIPGPPGLRGYDGNDGKTFRCEVFGGTAGITYDADGTNPQPTELDPFYAYMYDADQLIASEYLSFTWYVPVDKTLLLPPPIEVDGMQYHRQWFQPGVYGVYSTSKTNNKVGVTIAYTQPTYPYKSWQCSASASVVAARTGIQGVQGLPGDPALVTEAATISAFATTASDSYLSLQNSYSAGKAKLAVKDRTGNVKGYWRVGDTVNSFILRNYSGNADLIKMDTLRQLASISLLDRVGYERIKLINDGSMQITSATGLLWLALNSTSKTLTMYGADGSTPVFTVYSDGTWKGQEGWPGSSGLVLSKTTSGIGSWVSGGTGGSETQASILDKINDPVAGQILERQAATADNYSTAMIRVKGSNNAWRFRVDTKGQLSIFRNGRRIFGIMTTGGGSVVIGG